MSKAKKGPRPVKSQAVISRKQSSTAPGWTWWVVIGGVVLVGVLVIVLTRGGGTTAAAAPPEGVQSFDSAMLGRSHTDQPVTYEQTPPVGGNHSGQWQNCGVYAQPIASGNGVHSLEHGAVWITYEPALAPDQVAAVRALAVAKDGGGARFVLVSPFPGLPAPVVASAWGKQLSVQSAADPRLAQFIDAFRRGPQTPEPGASCAGGIGQPNG